ncbi:hypothetical protein [Ferruginibacter sp. HRS2-29]|uniref:hypothetical protein n=1 Tax=Ferruginibacter sp. HRS2-29 TaxID=2487334 RepID=UPI0020CC46E9|nr:hypothetical protein [Ferruginibacter sp. HRS2-29]MCP9752431.1 hypothetical protein [Ferruginibacter sp. HRS2-29]
MQEVIPRRIVVYAKDVMNITGRKERAARKLLADIRKKYKKKKGDFISVKDFSNFTGLDETTIAPFLV